MPIQDLEKNTATSRRNFLKATSLLGIGAGLLPSTPGIGATQNHSATDDSDGDFSAPQSGTLTLLQTTDVHC